MYVYVYVGLFDIERRIGGPLHYNLQTTTIFELRQISDCTQLKLIWPRFISMPLKGHQVPMNSKISIANKLVNLHILGNALSQILIIESFEIA